MRIDSGAMPIRSADSRNAISLAIIKKSMETVKENGDGLRKLLEQSVQPNLGKNIDVKV